MLQCHASSHDRLAGQTPSTGIDPSTKNSLHGAGHRNEIRTSGNLCWVRGRSVEKKRSGQCHSYIVLSRKNVFLAKFFDLNFKSFPLGNTATHNDRKDLWEITKYFTGH